MPETDQSAPILVIFGAGGITGQAAIHAARAKGYVVRAVDHTASEQTGSDAGVTHVTADVLQDDLRSQVSGADAVISCLGVGNDPQTLLDPPPLYTKGTKAICDAMQAEGIRRLIVISASFVEEKNRGPLWFKLPAMVALHRVFEQMAEMERNLANRPEIEWTAVRPGWLMEGAASGDYTVQADVIPETMIRTRHEDLAHFMVALAHSGDWLRATPAIARLEPPEASSLPEVAKEMLVG